jgi:ribulose-phosphate 3-epimerase
LTINPSTPTDVIEKYLDMTDMILLMSVEPGSGGQEYIPESTERIKEVKRMIKTSGRDIDLEVDGGIRLNNVREVLDAGANVIVAGSAVFHGDIKKNVSDFMQILNGVNK